MIDGACGIWHLANRGHVSWHAFAMMLAKTAGLDVTTVSLADTGGVPATVTVLASERGMVMPTLEHGIDRYMHDSQENWRVAVQQILNR